jgi:hypothetical protein
MTVKEIIAAYLKENGYDGLCWDGCGCVVKDICLTNEDCLMCVPAYRYQYVNGAECPNDSDCDAPCELHDDDGFVMLPEIKNCPRLRRVPV